MFFLYFIFSGLFFTILLSYGNHIIHVSPQLHVLVIIGQIDVEYYPSALTFIVVKVPESMKQLGIPFDPVFLGQPRFMSFK